MTQGLLSDLESDLVDAAGLPTVLLGRRLAARGLVTLTGATSPDLELVVAEVGGPPRPATVILDLGPGDADDMTEAGMECTCHHDQPCLHAVAVLLTLSGTVEPEPQADSSATRALAAPERPQPPVVPAWQRALDVVLTTPEPVAPRPSPLAGDRRSAPGKPAHPDAGGLGLSVSWVTPTRGSDVPQLELRPLLRSHTGAWVKTGAAWHELDRQQYSRSAAAPLTPQRRLQVSLLKELLALHRTTGSNGYYSHYNEKVRFDDFATASVWRVLTDLERAGVPLIQAAKGAGAVHLHEPVRLDVALSRDDDGLLRLGPRFTLADGNPLAFHELRLLGEVPHGLGWRVAHTTSPRSPFDLHLAPLQPDGLDDALRALTLPRIEVPPADEARFAEQYLPALTERFAVVTTDADLQAPTVGPPRLTARLAMLGGHRADVTFTWTYLYGTSTRVVDPDHDLRWRDRDAEDAVLARLAAALEPEFPDELVSVLPQARTIPRPRGEGSRRLHLRPLSFVGVATARFATRVLPAWREDPDIDVVLEVDAEPDVDYRFAGAPSVTLRAQDSGERDWFDLAVDVAVPRAGADPDDDPETVPFAELFRGLVRGDAQLLLESGTVVDLTAPELAQLRSLIEESRELHDSRGPIVRLSRLQGGLFEELEALGVLDEQARAWQESVGRPAGVDVGPFPVPEGVRATLRPYQEVGLDWLVRLYRLGLGGGVLADDMGLGKTLQTLALVCHVREHGLSQAPFLVVAPASVTHGWEREAAALTPGLRVAVVSQTAAKRGVPLADLAREADVVVTSYTLFRLEADDYETLEWAGLVLDEAQFAKNHASHAYRGAKTLPAPFKLAVTGTPMENHLGELWSLLSITVPGLFPRLDKFTEHYRKPIERAADGERLARLRRRIGPLMLRRTKADVLAELPDKQEQVVEIDLLPAHRRVYQTYLQRERTKVLGLLDDLNNNRIEVLRSLTLLRQAAIDPSLVDDKHAGVASTKLDAVRELLGDAIAEGHRVLVFSQFTRFLSKVRDRLVADGVDCCYLDGRTRNRGAVIDKFRSGESPVFLISLKAGGFGLNLTEADYAVLLDPWWNPAAEVQAVDRAHRIGQTRKVMVYRLVSKGTIEDKVMALKAEKAALFAGVMSGEEFAAPVLDAAAIAALLAE